MTTVTLEEAHEHLPELIAQLKPGEEVVITQADQPVARLIPAPPQSRKPREPGSMIGKLVIVEDDEEHLEDFKEYMP